MNAYRDGTHPSPFWACCTQPTVHAETACPCYDAFSLSSLAFPERPPIVAMPSRTLLLKTIHLPAVSSPTRTQPVCNARSTYAGPTLQPPSGQLWTPVIVTSGSRTRLGNLPVQVLPMRGRGPCGDLRIAFLRHATRWHSRPQQREGVAGATGRSRLLPTSCSATPSSPSELCQSKKHWQCHWTALAMPLLSVMRDIYNQAVVLPASRASAKPPELWA
ncbi:hypothetical protein OH77DRAFT_1015548 [Trametes cingulata]|nr:hypothetical protein OH77DRAFT_1015548 [Trametes cingulata]